MGGGGGSSIGAGGGRSKAVTYCDPAKWPGGEPEPPAKADCSDFDSDANALNLQCRTPGGVWAIDTDKMGTPADKSPPVVEPCGTTGNGLHFKGAGHSGWGADVAAAIVSQSVPVDVSAYSGMSFVVKSATASSLIFKVQNPYAQPPCGKCVEVDPMANQDCYSGYSKTVQLPADDVTPRVVKWTELAQQTYGYMPPNTQKFDVNNLVSVAFAFGTNVDFDVCIDDVKFLE